jgi:hypothetical protein
LYNQVFRKAYEEDTLPQVTLRRAEQTPNVSYL